MADRDLRSHRPHTARCRALLLTAVLTAAASTCGAIELVVVVRPAAAEDDRAAGYSGCVAGSRIVRVSTEGGEQVLTPTFDGACDPAVSFDGEHILFAGRLTAEDRWQIWRMDATGRSLTRITSGTGDSTSPVWVGAIFHLDDTAPTQRIAYLSTAHGWIDPRTGRPSTSLFTSDVDGANPTRISFSPAPDLGADVLDNGRLVYPRWTAPEGGGSNPRLAIMGLNIDGTDLMAFADQHSSPAYPHAVRVGRDGRVYFIESLSDELGGGALAFVSKRRPLLSRVVLPRPGEGVFLDPLPLADGGLLASFRGADADRFSLVRIAPDDGAVTGTVFATEGLDVLDAHELAPRPPTRGRSSVVDPGKTTGVFFCLSSHITDRPSLAELRDGGASRLRVIEHHTQRDLPVPERILGEAPVEPDGSFHIEVPAQTPLRFQLLDADGRILGEQRSWTWVMPREWRGCIGCHEDREMVAPNVLADAVVKPAVILGEATAKPGGGG